MRILIDGDSWAYTWSSEHDRNLQGPGFPELLRRRGWEVHCSALPGSSNLASVNRLHNLYVDYDLIIWIQTEPIRDWLRPQPDDSRPVLDVDLVLNMVRKHGSLDSAMEWYLKEHTYRSLAMVPKPIWIMGGCSKIARSSAIYDNLRVIWDSIPGFLFESRGDYQDCYYQNTHQWASREYADRVIESRNADIIADWYAATKAMNQKLNYWTLDTEYFNPDKWHPNLRAHELITEYLGSLLNKSA